MGAGLNIKPLLIRQHPVPNVPAAAEGVFKQPGLGRSRVETGLDGTVLDYRPISCRLTARPPVRHNVTPFPCNFGKVYFFEAKKLGEKIPKGS